MPTKDANPNAPCIAPSAGIRLIIAHAPLKERSKIDNDEEDAIVDSIGNSDNLYINIMG